MPLIHISDDTYKKLQELARDNGDTPEKVREVIKQLVDNAKRQLDPDPD